MNVTPHVGVWIETLIKEAEEKSRLVTPHVGVWIETLVNMFTCKVNKVTPHVGVWIETDNEYMYPIQNQ